jgi:hypothetical protein
MFTLGYNLNPPHHAQGRLSPKLLIASFLILLISGCKQAKPTAEDEEVQSQNVREFTWNVRQTQHLIGAVSPNFDDANDLKIKLAEGWNTASEEERKAAEQKWVRLWTSICETRPTSTGGSIKVVLYSPYGQTAKQWQAIGK